MAYGSERPASDLHLVDPRTAASLRREMLLVLGVSLGASAIWSILSIIDKATRQVALNKQTTSMNSSVTPDRPWLDVAYQLVGIGLELVPVALALYLLARVAVPQRAMRVYADHAPLEPTSRFSAARFVGFDLRRPGPDLAWGFGLAAVIGIPGLGLYLLARHLGLNTSIAAANLSGAMWWTTLILLLAAAQNAILEEVVMVGYLFTRLGQIGLAPWLVNVTSALVRGAYHLYQGFGGFVGNVVMGLLLGWVYQRKGRVMPLVVAHTVLDIVSFVGYSLLKGKVGWL